MTGTTTLELNLERDNTGIPAYAPQFASVHFSATLNGGSAQTFTIPSDAQTYIASFSYQPGATVWVARNTAAAEPAGSTFAATNSELNPGARTVYAGDVIHCVTSDTTADIGISIYAF